MIDKFLTFYYNQSNADDIQYIINDLIEKHREEVKQDFENKKKLIDDSFEQQKIYIENNKDSFILKKIIDENNKQQPPFYKEFDFLLKSNDILDENNEIILFSKRIYNENIISALKGKNNIYQLLYNISVLFNTNVNNNIFLKHLTFDELFIINNKLFFNFEFNYHKADENINYFCWFIIKLFDENFKFDDMDHKKDINKNNNIPKYIKEYLINTIFSERKELPIKIFKNISNLLK